MDNQTHKSTNHVQRKKQNIQMTKAMTMVTADN